MNTIYWTVAEIEENIFVSMSVHVFADNTHAVIMAETFDAYNRQWDSAEKAINFVTQTQKPFYYETFGSAYELVYKDPEDEEFLDMMEMVMATKAEAEYLMSPWYKKLWAKIKGAF